MKKKWATILLGVTMILISGYLLPAANAQAAAEAQSVVLDIPDGARAGPGFDVNKATAAYINLLNEEDRARSDSRNDCARLPSVKALAFSTLDP